jgi:hypothetical protein
VYGLSFRNHAGFRNTTPSWEGSITYSWCGLDINRKDSVIMAQIGNQPTNRKPNASITFYEPNTDAELFEELPGFVFSEIGVENFPQESGASIMIDPVVQLGGKMLGAANDDVGSTNPKLRAEHGRLLQAVC